MVVLIVVLSFFGLSFATVVESAQTSKKPAKAAPTPAKKKAKATPTPGKKAQAKATLAPKKALATTAKSKAAAKKPTAKSATQNKTTAKTKAADPKQKTSAKSNQKTADKKASNSKTAARNTKVPAKAKPAPVAAKKTPAKNPVVKKTAPTTASRTPVKTTERISGENPQIIVTDVSARIRSQAKATAPELSNAKLGTILQVTEKTPAWYRVQFSSGAKTSSGWISANSVNDLNSAGKDQIYRQIADRYYKGEGMDFATASELYEFLTRAGDDLGDSSPAEIELKRLLALRSALKSVPQGRAEENPYRAFLKANEKSVVYSEPSGEWLVVSNLFWDLRKKHEKSPLADQIAWEAAQNPLPGECEGYVNCYLFYARMTTGEYLSLFPNGKHNLQALTDLTNSLDPIAASLPDNKIYTGPSDVTDRAEFNSLIAELRTIVSRLPLTEKEKPLQQLKKIAEGFR